MEEIRTFTSNEFGSLRVIEIDGEPWFVGKDAALMLGYSNPSKAIQEHIDAEDKLNNKTLLSFQLNLGQRGGWLISEPGLYSLILSSKLPAAKQFKRWVTAEILPSIRRHGAYMTDDTLKKAIQSPDFLIQLATELKEEQERRRQLEEKVEQDRPKTVFADAVTVSQTSILVGDLAKILRQNGISIGQNRLYGWLREHGYLMKSGTSKNLPTQRSMESGWFEIAESTITRPDGNVIITRTTKVTGAGQIYFTNLFLDKLKKEAT